MADDAGLELVVVRSPASRRTGPRNLRRGRALSVRAGDLGQRDEREHSRERQGDHEDDELHVGERPVGRDFADTRGSCLVLDPDPVRFVDGLSVSRRRSRPRAAPRVASGSGQGSPRLPGVVAASAIVKTHQPRRKRKQDR